MNTVYVGLYNHYGPHEVESGEVESDPREGFIAGYVWNKRRAGVRLPYSKLRSEAEQVYSSGRAFYIEEK